MINIVLIDRIRELSETKTPFRRIKEMSSNWKAVVVVSVLALTLKSAAEQIVLLFK